MLRTCVCVPVTTLVIHQCREAVPCPSSIAPTPSTNDPTAASVLLSSRSRLSSLSPVPCFCIPSHAFWLPVHTFPYSSTHSPTVITAAGRGSNAEAASVTALTVPQRNRRDSRSFHGSLFTRPRHVCVCPLEACGEYSGAAAGCDGLDECSRCSGSTLRSQ